MLALTIAMMVVGAVLLFIESVTPGFAVFGVSGIVLLAVSAVLTLFTVQNGIILVCLEFGFLAAGIFLFVRRVKGSKSFDRLILSESLNEDSSGRMDLTAFLGKSGVAKTSLRPVGVAEIDGASVDVVSDGEYVAENTRITVKEISGGKIVVAETTEAGEKTN